MCFNFFWRDSVVRVGFAALSFALGASGVFAQGAPSHDPLRLLHRPIEPVAQALELRLDPNADGYSGRVEIDLVAHEAAREIRLHARDLDLGRIELVARAGGEAVNLAGERGDLGLLALTAQNELAVGAYRLSIHFSGKFRRDGVGLYKTEFEGAAYLFTQLEARYGRLAFPNWDEPDFKIPWQVTLIVPEGQAAFANSEVVHESVTAGWRTLAFARTPPMPTYLVAVAVGPFETMQVRGMSVPGRIITARGQSGLATAIAKESPKILTTLEDYFGIPYPYGKLDQLAVPEFTFGGMENAGLITYRDEAILRAPGDTDQENHRSLVQIVAHEIAHHWYGNLVTMAWWNDLWLNESFASWMEGKVLNAAYPELHYGLNAIGGKQRAMRIDALPSTGPVRRTITAGDDPEKFVDSLSYEKGEAVLTMIESWIGPDAFRAAMRRYFAKHRWGSARAEDLWAAFGEASSDDVPAMVSSFIEQPGVPQVSVDVLAGDRVRLRQKRYAALGGALPAESERSLWQVPLVFKYAVDGAIRTERVLLAEREQVVKIPGISRAHWVFPNAGEAGYYRWQIDERREAELVHVGRDGLEPIERVGLLLNAAAMHEAGEMPAGRRLGLLVEFSRDPVAEVARRAVSAILRMRSTYLEDGDEALFAEFCRVTLRPVLDRIGLRPAQGETPEVASLRRELIVALGVRGNDPDVIAMARELMAQLVKDPRSVDAGLAEAVASVAAWHGDRALFDATERAFRAATVPTDRAIFLSALGSFRDRGLCERALALSLGEGLRSHERATIAAYMAEGSMLHRELAVTWMMTNFDVLRGTTSEHTVSSLINLAEGPDAALFARVREFLSAPERISDSAEKSIAEACDRDAQAQALRKRGQQEMRRSLTQVAGKT